MKKLLKMLGLREPVFYIDEPGGGGGGNPPGGDPPPNPPAPASGLDAERQNISRWFAAGRKPGRLPQRRSHLLPFIRADRSQIP